jgi:hypothetical protein
MYSSSNVFLDVDMGRVCNTLVRAGMYKILVGKPEGKYHLRVPDEDGR